MALLDFKYSKPELAQFKPKYRYISFNNATELAAKIIGDVKKAETFLMGSLQRGVICVFNLDGWYAPKHSLNGERWRSGYFVEPTLRKLIADELGETKTGEYINARESKSHTESALDDSADSQVDKIISWQDDPNILKLEKQRKAILEVISLKKFEPMAIPDGEKGTIEMICIANYPLIFDKDSSFTTAWKKSRDLFKMANHASFAKRGRQ